MHMTFNQARNYTPPVKVDLPSTRSRSLEHVNICTNTNKPVALDRNCLYIWMLIPHRDDLAVVIDCVGALCVGYRTAERQDKDPETVCDGTQERRWPVHFLSIQVIVMFQCVLKSTGIFL